MVNLVVYTCVFGDTDPLRDPVIAGGSRFVCFTDQPIKSKVWEIVTLPKHDAPKRACRQYKQPSHLIFPDAEATLWLDAQFQLTADPMALLAKYGGEFTGFRHHKRNRITDECEAIIKAGKAKPEAVRAQLAAYKAQGWDTDANPQRAITNGGCMLRRHTDKVKRFNDASPHVKSASCSGVVALEAAKQRGAKRILLLGADFRGSHYFGDYRNGLQNTTDKRRAIHRAQFEQWQRLNKGIEVLNCTEGSMLECFPRVALAEALRG